MPSPKKLTQEQKEVLIKYSNLVTKYLFNSPDISNQNLLMLTPQQLSLLATQIFSNFDAEMNIFAETINMENGAGGFLTFPPLIEAVKKQITADMGFYEPYSQLYDTVVKTLANFLYTKGVIPAEVKLNINNIIGGNGTTQLYNHALRQIFLNAQKKGSVIRVAPCYGLFAEQVFQCGGEIKTVNLKPENNWKLTPAQLEAAVLQENQRLLKKYIRYINFEFDNFLSEFTALGFDSQQLPTFIGKQPDLSHAELLANLKAIKKVAQKIYPTKYKAQAEDIFEFATLPKLPSLPRVLALELAIPANPTGVIYTQEEINELDKVRRKYELAVIEDIMHGEIFYGNTTPGYFGMVPGKPYKQITLFGPSKSHCVASMRIAACYFTVEFSVLKPDRMATSKQGGIENSLYADSLNLTPMQQAALKTAYQITEERKDYLNQNTAEYEFRIKLLYFLINGSENAYALNANERKKITEYLQQHISSTEKLTQLMRGVEDLTSINLPEATFFLTVDLSKWANSFIGTVKLVNGADFYKAILAVCNISTVFSEAMQYSEKPLLRLSVAIGENTDSRTGRLQIIEAVERLHYFANLLTLKPDNEVVATLGILDALIGNDGEKIQSCLKAGGRIDYYKNTGWHLLLNYFKTQNRLAAFKLNNDIETLSFKNKLLIQAIRLKNYEAIEKLLIGGADVHGISSTQPVSTPYFNPEVTPLLIALTNNDEKAIKILLQYGAIDFYCHSRQLILDEKQKPVLLVDAFFRSYCKSNQLIEKKLASLGMQKLDIKYQPALGDAAEKFYISFMLDRNIENIFNILNVAFAVKNDRGVLMLNRQNLNMLISNFDKIKIPGKEVSFATNPYLFLNASNDTVVVNLDDAELKEYSVASIKKGCISSP